MSNIYRRPDSFGLYKTASDLEKSCAQQRCFIQEMTCSLLNYNKGSKRSNIFEVLYGRGVMCCIETWSRHSVSFNLVSCCHGNDLLDKCNNKFKTNEKNKKSRQG